MGSGKITMNNDTKILTTVEILLTDINRGSCKLYMRFITRENGAATLFFYTHQPCTTSTLAPLELHIPSLLCLFYHRNNAFTDHMLLLLLPTVVLPSLETKWEKNSTDAHYRTPAGKFYIPKACPLTLRTRRKTLNIRLWYHYQAIVEKLLFSIPSTCNTLQRPSERGTSPSY